jgi:2-polyprenyl-6-methoxyphenol hydroxylase-like FAD-dependent oxidoreductase
LRAIPHFWLAGRAVHDPDACTKVRYASYGASCDAELVSIPRPVLRQNLVALAEESGVSVMFNTCVTGADSDLVEVTYADENGYIGRKRADLVVFSDGLHSLAHNLQGPKSTDFVKVWSESRSSFTAIIPAGKGGNLSLRHIHFWHEPDGEGFTVGIPNGDGSIALLVASRFPDVDEEIHPFVTAKTARARLKRDFPRIFEQAPYLAEQLPNRRRGWFYYKLVNQYQVGRRGIIVGDAGCVVPPWAGYGANTAMYAAASLAYQIGRSPYDLQAALDIYSCQQRQVARSLMAFAHDQGDFLSSEVSHDPSGRSEAALGPMVQAARRGAKKDMPPERRPSQSSSARARSATLRTA